MTLATREYLLYQPSKGTSYGQVMRARKIPDLVHGIDRFIAALMVPDQYRSMELTVQGYGADVPTAEQMAQAVQWRFGQPTSQHTNPPEPHFASFIAEWKLTEDQLPTASEFLLNGCPWPKLEHGGIHLIRTLGFRWKADRGDELMPDQSTGYRSSDGGLSSLITFSIGNHPLVQPTLNFPFRDFSDDCLALLRRIEDQQLFRLNPRHFKHAAPTKRGTGVTFRRITPPTW